MADEIVDHAVESVEPELMFIILSESLQQATPQKNALSNAPRLVAAGLMGALPMRIIPSYFSFAITYGIQGVDYNRDNMTHFTVRDPDGEIFADSPTNAIGRPDSLFTLPEDESHVIVGASLQNMWITKTGWYTIEVYFNGQLMGTRRFPVREVGVGV